MKLERIKCKPLERAKNLCTSQSFIIGCTGQKAAIMDKQLNLIHTVEGLEYVYSADVSPDETKLLLISNGNKFYVYLHKSNCIFVVFAVRSNKYGCRWFNKTFIRR